jgi:hypothetical protein
MKRAFFIGGMLLYNFMISLVANDLSISTTGTTLVDTPSSIGTTLSSFIDILRMFGDMLTFSISGIPAIFIIIFFYLPNIVLMIIILTLIFNRD